MSEKPECVWKPEEGVMATTTKHIDRLADRVRAGAWEAPEHTTG